MRIVNLSVKDKIKGRCALFIGGLARQTGLTTRAIRHYEALGLLPGPKRTEAGYRVYDEADAERLRFIQGAKALGLSLDEIKEILDLWAAGTHPCQHVRMLLEQKLAEIDSRIEQLTRFRDGLRAYKTRMDALPLAPDVPCRHIAGASGLAGFPSTSEEPAG